MSLSLVTPATTEPLSLAEAQAQCRIDTDDESIFLESLITTAREYAEGFTRRAFITQTWDLTLAAFPSEGELWIPKAPLQSSPTAPVVTYVGTDGVTQTLSSSLYTVDAPSGPQSRPGRLLLGYGLSWPSTRDVANAVTVRFVAGYGLAPAVPAGIKAAMKLLVAHWWTNRVPGVAGSMAELPHSIDALLWQYKAF